VNPNISKGIISYIFDKNVDMCNKWMPKWRRSPQQWKVAYISSINKK
jgi:hypothetical protein